MVIIKVDLNCDLGEGFGVYKIGRDEEILDLVTSANIACGFHAGDPTVMRKTVELALKKEVHIGAHPGFNDLIGFGRREMKLAPREVYDLTIYQLGALYGFVKSEGGKMHHVKPHGALYNMATKDKKIAEAIAEAVYMLDPELILYGPYNSELIYSGKKLGLQTAHEVFADRTYQKDGSLTPRSNPKAMIEKEEDAISQVIQMVKNKKVQTQEGVEVPIKADTICIHGDSPYAVIFAKQVKKALENEGIIVQGIN